MRVLGWWAAVVVLPIGLLFVLFSEQQADDRLEQFYKRAGQIEALSLGGSHTRALHFPSMGLNGYSLADDGGDIRLAELKLRLAANRMPNLHHVFLTISPGFLSYDRIAGVPGDFPDAEIRYAPSPSSIFTLSFSDLGLWIRAQALYFREQMLEVNRKSKQAISTFIRGQDDAADVGDCSFPDNAADHPHEDGILNGFARTPVASSCMTPEYEIRDASRRVNLFKKSLERAPDTQQQNLKLLHRISETVKSHGAVLVLVVSPTAKTYFNDPRLQDLWRAERVHYEKLAKRDHVLIVDAHGIFFDVPYQKHNIWFSDPDHITLEGAKIHSKRLLSILKKVPGEAGLQQAAF